MAGDEGTGAMAGDEGTGAMAGDEGTGATGGDEGTGATGGDEGTGATGGGTGSCEAADNDSPEEPGWLFEAEPHRGELCAAAEQYFIVTVPAGETLTLLTRLPDGSATVELVDETGALLAASSSHEDGRLVVWQNGTQSASEQLLRLVGGAADTSFSAQFWTGPAACEPSVNGSWQASRSIASGESTSGAICPDEVDYYSITVPAGQLLRSTLTYPTAGGAVRSATLLDPAAHPDPYEGIGGAASWGDVTTVVALTENEGDESDYFVRVFGAQNSYELTLDVAACFAGENLSLEAAYWLDDGDRWDGQICEGTGLYYLATVPAGETLTVKLDFNQAGGDLDLELRDEDGDLLDSSTGTGNGELGTYENTSSSDLTVEVRVVGNSSATNDFTIAAYVDDGECLVSGQGEAETAVAVFDGDELGGRLCPGEVDYFTMTVPAGEFFRARTNAAHDAGAIRLDVAAVTGVALSVSYGTQSDTSELSGQNQTDAPVEVPFWVKGGANSYDLDVEIGPCLPSQNGNPDDAEQLFEGTFVNQYERSICAGEEQYFVVDVAPGEELTMQILFAHADGDLRLTVIDEAMNEITSAGSGDSERVSVVNPLGTVQTYLVRVEGDSSSHSRFVTQMWSGDPACEPSDNASEGAATTLALGAPAVAGALCAEESDYYQVLVPANVDVVVTLDWEPEHGDVELVPLCPGACPMVVGTGIFGTQDAYIQGSGAEFVQRFMVLGAANTYSLGAALD